MPPRCALALPLLALLALAGCAASESQSVARPPAGASPLRVSPAQFGTLRWLEGRWHGTEPNGNAFYEGYRFADDSTITTYTYTDSTSLTPSDSGAIALRGGVVETGSGGALWVVAELAPGRVHFEPAANARNAFTWVRTSPDTWTATLAYPEANERPAREIVYPMRRLGP